MASRAKKPAGKGGKARGTAERRFRPVAFVRRWLLRLGLGMAMLMVALVALFAVVNPPTTHTIWSEQRRLGAVDHAWVDADEIAPVMLRAAVAAEDANFCTHWGFDMGAIRAAIEDGAQRGGSTISQQVVKNVYLWQARSYLRKALEAVMTPMIEAIWPKRRILEVYLNVAEFDEGIFGVDAAARHYFGVAPDALTPSQAALLAAVLPNPKERDADNPSAALKRRARMIEDGAALIAQDGRAACFEN